ncbi:mRNA export factor [Anaeramoeba ignava]|uniref:mRNA export factor n=1 Tax=Anaeramoeba ignava TaxID=1746090 RepID=A0A9Q0RA17_ANAIG|nr:mRNA export factor [Anaeramoeba ignava]
MEFTKIEDNPPLDSVSSLHFTQKPENLLTATSWDNFVRIWSIDKDKAKFIGKQEFSSAPLCSSWSYDSKALFIGGTDNQAYLWNLEKESIESFGEHSQPIKEIFSFPENQNLILTGSWDKTIKFWDLRQGQNPINTTFLEGKVFSMDMRFPYLVVVDSTKGIYAFDLGSGYNCVQRTRSSFKQARVISLFPDLKGYAFGSIDGRVSITYLKEEEKDNNFSFRCHWKENEIFAVNDIAFHPKYGTFATVGSDGLFYFWCKETKSKLKKSIPFENSITRCSFNHDGSIFSFAVGYDWHKGFIGSTAKKERSLCLYLPKEKEIQAK